MLLVTKDFPFIQLSKFKNIDFDMVWDKKCIEFVCLSCKIVCSFHKIFCKRRKHFIYILRLSDKPSPYSFQIRLERLRESKSLMVILQSAPFFIQKTFKTCKNGACRTVRYVLATDGKEHCLEFYRAL